jgi:hypothetical protein
MHSLSLFLNPSPKKQAATHHADPALAIATATNNDKTSVR